jgi:hypothetical protein
MVRLGNAAELGSLQRRAAICRGSVVDCCRAAAQRLPLRAEVCRSGRGPEAEGPLPRPGVWGRGRGWGGRVGTPGWAASGHLVCIYMLTACYIYPMYIRRGALVGVRSDS